MIIPSEVTNFNRDDFELQELVLWAISVPTKPADRQASIINKFLVQYLQPGELPFDTVLRLRATRELLPSLQLLKIGQYTRIINAWVRVASLVTSDKFNLRSASTDDFEAIPGIGPKTSRFIILHSRKDACVACLDTHLIKYMSEHMGMRGLTPPGANVRLYKELEVVLLAHIKLFSHTPAEFDLMVWNHYNSKGQLPLPQVSL